MKIVKPDEKPRKRLPKHLVKLALDLSERLENERRAEKGLPPIKWPVWGGPKKT